MFCKTCGTKLDDGVKFCPSCGTAVAVPAPFAEQPAFTPDPEPKAAPIFAQPEPTAPMYTPVEPQPEYAPEPQPVYAPVYAAAAPRPMGDPSDILTWGIIGLVCSFLISILGIIFSAIAISKAKNYLNTYGELPGQARTGRGLAIAGLIISILSTVLVALLFILFFSTIATFAQYY